MQADYNTALEVYNRFPDDVKDPYFNPYYVLGDAARDPSLEPVFFIYQNSGEVFYHGFHLGKIEGSPYFDIQSPYAYGGPVASTGDPDFLALAWQDYLSWCRDNHILAEFVRFHPRLENWRYYPGETRYMRETVWIGLQTDGLFLSYSPRVRTAVRKALKNRLRVEWVNTPDGYIMFNDMYTRAMRRLNADQFYFFPPGYFHKLQKWDNCRLAFCFRGGDILAAALFLQEAHIMEYHLAASTAEGNKYNAGSLILDRAAATGRELGCRYLHLGGGTDNRVDNPLLFFKAGFSSRRAPFRIGKIIHAPEAYEKMQGEWKKRFGGYSDRVLFYRYPLKNLV